MPIKYDSSKFSADAELLKALANPMRLWIVCELLQAEHHVGEFVESIGADFAIVSRQIAHLRRKGLVTSRRDGREIWYSADRDVIGCLLKPLTAAL